MAKGYHTKFLPIAYGHRPRAFFIQILHFFHVQLMNKQKDPLTTPEKNKSSRNPFGWMVLILFGALVYTVSPWDIIPDILGPFGMTDDIVLWAVIIGKGLSWFFQRQK
jgi:hypothetical protein